MNKVSRLYIEERHNLSGPLVGSTMVECLTRDQGAMRSSLTGVTAVCP